MLLGAAHTQPYVIYFLCASMEVYPHRLRLCTIISIHTHTHTCIMLLGAAHYTHNHVSSFFPYSYTRYLRLYGGLPTQVTITNFISSLHISTGSGVHGAGGWRPVSLSQLYSSSSQWVPEREGESRSAREVQRDAAHTQPQRPELCRQRRLSGSVCVCVCVCVRACVRACVCVRVCM